MLRTLIEPRHGRIIPRDLLESTSSVVQPLVGRMILIRRHLQGNAGSFDPQGVGLPAFEGTPAFSGPITTNWAAVRLEATRIDNKHAE